ncbi:P-loop containing nucleoside triphosphate hydrolase protein [Triangularia verruculosa]|uniref:P-loop containing nucleoside triphosphate hydrolase protein n=1 Tax=Triangularia verruculosa TaxID=2587418 RepID=A0AAN6XMS4_9PEZI|nr:P-loop containing nucleoside triphosphate hydrolase protein [Triangularia verruculosa]
MRSPHINHTPTTSLSSPPAANPLQSPTQHDSGPPIPISITICGDGGCGKSSITLRLVRSGQPGSWTDDYDPTIEDSYSITRRIDGITYHLSLTDTAGQEEYRGMWASSNLSSDAFLLVYDITSLDSLHALEYFNDLIDMEAETRIDNAARARKAGLSVKSPTMGDFGGLGETGKMIPPVKIVAGNKCDLKESRAVPARDGLEWARRRGCGFMETSARLEVNIEETFELIVRRVVEGRRLAEMEADELLGGGGGGGEVGNKRGMTKPLTPLPDQPDGGEEKELGRRGVSVGGEMGRGGFWKRLRCW